VYERVILWATPAFFLLIALELLISGWRRRAPYRLADAINSIALGQMSTYVGVFGRVLGFGLYVLVFEHARLFRIEASSPVAWVGGLVLYDFLYYWYHRLGHEVNVLWAAHVVHHQSEEFNLSTALRQTATSYLFSGLFYLPMAVLGFPPAVLLGVGLIDLLYQFWIHTEQVGSLGWFDRVFASPSNHRVHHAVNDVYLDRNYGGILILWDRLFGSFQPERAAEPPVYGTRDPLRSWNPVWANLHSYAALAADSWHARNWGDKLGVWFRHPGWRPADVAVRYPKAEFRLGATGKFRPTLTRSLAAYCATQSLLILALGTHFLSVAPRWEPWAVVGYLAWLALSLAIVGGLLEARRAYVRAEAVRLVISAALLLAVLPGAPLWPWAAATLAVVGLGAWLWRAGREASGALPAPASA
jgi:sterol desaturase/sphingolipid hydroxylase (fatty acid hydroxylase superfamily)